MADPSPQERADYLVRKLEQFIREGKTEHGMSFKTWQGMSRAELVNSFADIEARQDRRRADVTIRRMLIVAAAAIVTIGFWGTVMAVDRRYGWVAAVLLVVSGLILAGLALELGLRQALNRLSTRRRKAGFGRIADFDRQLKQLETEIRRQVEKAKDKAADPP
jgi:hypothetical protein